MKRPRRISTTTTALYVVAALLALNMVLMLSRDGAPSWISAAYAQRQAPIAGGAGLFVMPAQLERDRWGCYLMDVDRGTLAVYQYVPGKRELEFVAARKFTNDTKLENYNTFPSPRAVLDIVNKDGNNRDGAAAGTGAGATTVPQEQPRNDTDRP